jgi:hypothetical protein
MTDRVDTSKDSNEDTAIEAAANCAVAQAESSELGVRNVPALSGRQSTDPHVDPAGQSRLR